MIPDILIKPVAFLLSTKTYKNFARNILSGWTLRVYGYPKVKSSVYWEIKEIVTKEPESLFVFCSVDKKMMSYKMQHLFTNCKFSHCGFIAQENGNLIIKHVTTSGFIKEPLLDFLPKCDHFYVGKMPVADKSEANRRLSLLEHLCTADSFDYDYSLQLEPELISLICNPESDIPTNFKFKMYCSEFIYLVGKDLMTKFNPTWVGDRYLFEPDDVYAGTERFFEV